MPLHVGRSRGALWAGAGPVNNRGLQVIRSVLLLTQGIKAINRLFRVIPNDAFCSSLTSLVTNLGHESSCHCAWKAEDRERPQYLASSRLALCLVRTRVFGRIARTGMSHLILPLRRRELSTLLAPMNKSISCRRELSLTPQYRSLARPCGDLGITTSKNSSRSGYGRNANRARWLYTKVV